MADKSALDAWRKAGEHLPPVLRGFHDQKDVFKTIHEWYGRASEGEFWNHDGRISWVDGQIYVIDWFLWFMAAHGYTLQRSRKPGLVFHDLNESVASRRQQDADAFAAMLEKDREERAGEGPPSTNGRDPR